MSDAPRPAVGNGTKVALTYGLAALVIACATLLRALGAVDASFVAYAFGLALSAVGFYHAPAPGRASAGQEVTG